MSKCNNQNGWCAPLIIYLSLSVIGMIGILRQPNKKMINILTSFLWTLFWTFVMYTLCKNCHSGWAWLILLFPLILWGILSMFVVSSLSQTVGSCNLVNGECITTLDADDCKKVGGKFSKGQWCEK